MEQNNDEKTIISKLFISRERIVERLNSLVDLSHGSISIIEETGEIYLENPSKLNNTERIFLFLLGTYLAYKSELKDTPYITLSEIASKLSVPNTTIPAPMSNLLKKKVVLKSEKGSYYLNYDNYRKIKEILLEIKEKNGKS